MKRRTRQTPSQAKPCRNTSAAWSLSHPKNLPGKTLLSKTGSESKLPLNTPGHNYTCELNCRCFSWVSEVWWDEPRLKTLQFVPINQSSARAKRQHNRPIALLLAVCDSCASCVWLAIFMKISCSMIALSSEPDKMQFCSIIKHTI